MASSSDENTTQQPTDTDDCSQIQPNQQQQQQNNNTKKWSIGFAVFLLCFINAINYMNRYSLPAVVPRLKTAFNLSDTQLGLIQTCFEIIYVISSPIFGYFGDRFNRLHIIAISLVIANASNVAASFVPETSFGLLLLTRSLLAMGETACSNIGPAIIGDMFVGKKRTLVLSLFQFAIPVGLCVGYMSSSLVVDYLNNWRWAFRLNAGPMTICVFLLLIFVREPNRGEAEKAAGLILMEKSSFYNDLRYIGKIRSFVLMTLGFVGVTFTTEATCYWVPSMVSRMYQVTGIAEVSDSELGLIFGGVSIVAGIVGVVMGPAVSNGLLKPRYGPTADGIVCGVNMIIAAPCVYMVVISSQIHNAVAIWISVFMATTLICSCFVLISDITMTVVVPTRRATAAALMSAVSHLLGDAPSPYLIGTVSDELRKMETNLDPPGSVNLMADFISIQRSLFLPAFVITLSGGLFLMGSLFINEDADKATKLSHQTTGDVDIDNSNNQSDDTQSTAGLLEGAPHGDEARGLINC